jgi:hypothetical protein
MSTITLAPAPVRTRLRLTRRGRVVITGLVSLPLVLGVLFTSLNGGGATATSERSAASFEYVTIQAGESLWGLAESIAPDADPRDVISDILSLNQVSTADVHPGLRLALPAAYTG